jgi:dolichol kinase
MYQRSYQIDYFYGWRYLFSPEFRDQARKKTGKSLMLHSMFMVGGFISILLSSAALVLVAMAVVELVK